MKIIRTWVRFPSPWVETGGLKNLRWTEGQGAANTAALVVFVAIAHRVELGDCLATVTYDDLCAATNLSRVMIARGIKVLESLKLIERKVGGRSTFRINNLDEGIRWSKLPARGLYSGKSINAFRNISLRRNVELDAMKLFILFVVRRNNKKNIVELSYEKIEIYTGIARPRIRTAISFLASIGLLHLERSVTNASDGSMFNAYRIPYIDPYNHPAAQVRS